MPLSTQPYKGARDFYPEDKRLQDYMFGVMRKVAKRFGYAEYDAPVLEPLELYKAKSGQEIVNEQTYNFVDRGGREVAIRPEMTPTVSRMVAARRQELAYPLRWFSIPNLWRYERPQRGRLREHWQLNVDIFGVAGVAADHEIIMVADSLLKEFGADAGMYEIRLNSRKLVDCVLRDHLSIDEEKSLALTKLIDRMHKMDRQKFSEEVGQLLSGSPEDTVKQVLQLLEGKSIEDLPEPLLTTGQADELRQLIKLLEDSGVSNARLDISLMRGFDYYTDIVFEVYDTDPANNRSMFGGGRYDGLVGLFGVEPVPTVGFGMGDVTLHNFLEGHNLLPDLASATDLHLLTVGNVYDGASRLAQVLREQEVNVAVDATDRKLDKKIKSAEKQGARLIAVVGEEEISSGKVVLKDLTTGQQDSFSPQDLVSFLKDYRKR
jgi:histidyl-tRNA synthetase